jgi:hypothetical protein
MLMLAKTPILVVTLSHDDVESSARPRRTARRGQDRAIDTDVASRTAAERRAAQLLAMFMGHYATASAIRRSWLPAGPFTRTTDRDSALAGSDKARTFSPKRCPVAAKARNELALGFGIPRRSGSPSRLFNQALRDMPV